MTAIIARIMRVCLRPGLKDKPVVVLSNNDGCVVARSNEAKKMGIKADVRVVSIIRKAPTYFRYSIDERFIYLYGMEHLDLKAWGEDLFYL